MNAELLLEHFHRLGDAPDALPRLRRFILDLAVRGKLVDQSAKDEPASLLLKKIAKARNEALESGVIKKLPHPKPVAQEEIPFAVPSGWEVCRMVSVASKLGAGSTPRGGKAVYQNEGVPFLRSQNVYNDSLRLDDVALIPKAIHERMSGTHIQPKDLLLNITGASIGRCAIVSDDFEEGNVSQHVAIIRLFDPSIRAFLHLSLISPHYQNVIDDVQVGVSREGLSMQGLKQFAMLIPPLAEQQRIVAKVDEPMALCDTLEAAQREREQQRTRLTAASWQALTTEGTAAPARFALEQLPALTTRPEQVKALRQTILDLAVRGKLVEQDPKDEPASVLLKKIDVVQARLLKDKEIRKQTDYEELSIDELPCVLPINWAWRRVGQLGYTQTGTTPTTGNSEYFGDFIPFVKPGDMDGGSIDYSGPGISELGIRHSRLIPANSVLMVCVGSTIGKVNRCDREICCNQQINALTPYAAGLSTFLHYAMKSTLFQELVRAKAGMGTLPILSKGKWEQLPIPLPPLAEQVRIVVKVDALMALCDGLEAALREGEALKAKALEAVLQSEVLPRPAAPTPVKQLPKPQAKHVYATMEQEMLFAAEPAVLMATTRGRGRPRKDATHTATAVNSIAAYFKQHPGWHAKSDVLAATSIDTGLWYAAIKALLEQGLVERMGEKKGARYRVGGKPQ